MSLSVESGRGHRYSSCGRSTASLFSIAVLGGGEATATDWYGAIGSYRETTFCPKGSNDASILEQVVEIQYGESKMVVHQMTAT